MDVIFESQRLLFRLFTVEDAALIYQLNQDPEVIRYTADPVTSLEQATEILENVILPQYVLYNHGRWAVHLKNDLQFIGWCGLKFRPENHEVDLGYRFSKEYWGRGYATEASFACLKYGFEKLGLQRIVARADEKNAASVRVLEKVGMKYIGDQFVDHGLARTYELINPSVS